jgi:flagellar protein FlbC
VAFASGVRIETEQLVADTTTASINYHKSPPSETSEFLSILQSKVEQKKELPQNSEGLEKDASMEKELKAGIAKAFKPGVKAKTERIGIRLRGLLGKEVGGKALGEANANNEIGSEEPKKDLIRAVKDNRAKVGSSSEEQIDQIVKDPAIEDGKREKTQAEGLSFERSVAQQRQAESKVQPPVSEGRTSGEALARIGEAKNASGAAKLVILDLRTRRENEGIRAGRAEREVNAPGSISKPSPTDRAQEALNAPKAFRALETEPGAIQMRVFSPFASEQTQEGFRSEQMKEGLFETRGTVIDRFKETLRSEVVRNTSIILRDEGKGELRLILKPESLGNVRIRLTLNNNHIEGRIIVENNTVKEMFETNLQNLNNAFQKEGFSSSFLEVSVSGGNEQRRQKETQVPAFSAAQEFENAMPVQSELICEDWLINITV